MTGRTAFMIPRIRFVGYNFFDFRQNVARYEIHTRFVSLLRISIRLTTNITRDAIVIERWMIHYQHICHHTKPTIFTGLCGYGIKCLTWNSLLTAITNHHWKCVAHSHSQFPWLGDFFPFWLFQLTPSNLAFVSPPILLKSSVFWIIMFPHHRYVSLFPKLDTKLNVDIFNHATTMPPYLEWSRSFYKHVI